MENEIQSINVGDPRFSILQKEGTEKVEVMK